MRALTLRQPFASLVAEGIKTIETRVWKPKKSGDMLICAGLGKNINLHHIFHHYYDNRKFHPDHTVKGIALCVVEIYRVRKMLDMDIEDAVCMPYPHAQSWFLRNVRPVEPFKVKGMQSFFDVNDQLIHYKDVPKSQCPGCGHWHNDLDGFGVLHCDICGYCKHPNSTDGVCGFCGETIKKQ